MGNVQQHTGNDALQKGAGGLMHVLPDLRAHVSAGRAGGHRNAALQHLSERVHGASRRLRGAASGSPILFVACLVAIFCGFFHHVTQLVLGPPSGAPREVICPWKTYPIVALSLLVIAIAFWFPAPLYQLVDGAARILAVPQ